MTTEIIQKNKALFLDRDGTINLDTGYVFDPEKLTVLDGASDAIAMARTAGFHIVIVSNQSCIGRAYTTAEMVHQTNQRLQEMLLQENQNAIIDVTLIAPDHPDAPTNRRKPGPGMILEATEKLSLDILACWIIGDKKSDPESGLAAGIPKNQCLLVSPNREDAVGQNSMRESFPFFTGLREAVSYILG